MPVVAKQEISDRIENYFHGVLKDVPGHGPLFEHCWACKAAIYAVQTAPKQQRPKSTFDAPVAIARAS